MSAGRSYSWKLKEWLSLTRGRQAVAKKPNREQRPYSLAHFGESEMNISRRKLLAGAVAVPTVAAVAAWGQSGHPRHDRPEVRIDTAEGKRLVTANGIPDHATGDFPNAHDPVPMRPQQIKLQMPLLASIADKTQPLDMWLLASQ